MKSTLTEKTYDSIHMITANYETLTLTSLDGVTYEELEDNTWIGVNGEHQGDVRYRYVGTHGGGISLFPEYELVDGKWYSLRNGRLAPPAVKK